MPYLGNAPSAAFQSVAYQDLTGGTGTSFTLSHAVSSAQEIEVFVNNVRQEPTVAYSAVGTTLTMTGTIAATDDFYVVFQGKAVGSVSHPTTSPLAATTGNFTGNVTSSGTVTATSFSGDGSALTGVSAGKVLNVVQTVETSVSSYSCAAGAFVDLGISASITPSSASNKILVIASASVSTNVVDQACVITLYQGGSPSSFIGDAAGNRQRNTATAAVSYDRHFGTCAFSYLASVTDTNPVTFELYGSHTSTVTRTLYVNQASSDSDVNYVHRGASSIILMEIEN